MNMFPINLKLPEMEHPSLYEEGEHPSELLKSINNKLDSQNQIIENQKTQIAELKQVNAQLNQQIDFAKQEVLSAKTESKKASVLGILGIIIAFVSLCFEVIPRF